nr:methyltransferase domain-containing protein [Pseudenhygromyxa sp. WMMC2535]
MGAEISVVLPDFVLDQLARPSGPLAPLTGLAVDALSAGSIAAGLGALAAAPGERVVVLGLGGGALLPALLSSVGGGGQVFAFDRSQGMLASLRRRHLVARLQGRLRLERGAAEALPLGDGVFDAALSLTGVVSWPDLDAAMYELARVLRVGGRVVLGVPDPDRVRELGFMARGARVVDAERFVGEFERWGFASRGVEAARGGGAVVIGERLDEGQDL